MKNLKGTVATENHNGRIRLRWSHNGQRYCLALGLPWSKPNLKAAQQKATQIELDIVSCNFDPNLNKYSPLPKKPQQSPSGTQLFETFTLSKGEFLESRSLEKYRLTHHNFTQFFGPKPARTITPDDAEKFLKWLIIRLEGGTVRERICLLNAAWNWGIQHELVDSNPWVGLTSRIKVPPKQLPKPFSLEEIAAILQTFRTDRYYSYLTDYVEFLFGTGCRTGEAIGLCWKHLSDDCATAWIGESFSRGISKSTKTNRARTLTLTPRLQAVLLARKVSSPGSLIFPSLHGRHFDDHNFRNRAWVKVLIKAGVEYRKPYLTRHTFISHCLHQGMNPVIVAELTGHRVETLYQHYAGCVNSRTKLPSLGLD